MGEKARHEVISGLHVHALADDLSGAAETAAALLPAFGTGELRLAGTGSADSSAPTGDAHIAQEAALVVLDLDSRHAPAEAAAGAVRRALRAPGARSARTFLKVDSLLRGNVAATVAAAGPVVLAPALPSGGRTVRDGIPRLDGVPLHRGDSWRAETTAAPATLAALLDPLPCRVVPLAAVRSRGLDEALRAGLDAGEIPVCDAETDADLDAVAAAALRAGPEVRLAGSGGLAAALGRALAHRATPEPPAPEPPALEPTVLEPTAPETPGTDRAHGLLVVVGTAERTAREQVRHLAGTGARHFPLEVTALLTADPDLAPITAALRRAPVVLTADAADGVDPARSRALVRRLADTARRVVRGADRPVDLVLTGGETARRVLDALDVRALTPLTQIHHGAVHSRTSGGTSVVTRPGSFGEADSLVRIAAHLRPPTEG
ncbi:four-carbon acid sugar kinase family protein [Saccharopolyspora sp. NPDC047091]|uniref:four-carbon acid sugar kinase family protein n=1 Tax=Saccharopolyspora sp. NPDC047091 TaxID=3155924 RepID=UPI00340288C5